MYNDQISLRKELHYVGNVVYLASLDTSKKALQGDCGMPALEVPRLFFVQGCISVCGDTLYYVRSPHPHLGTGMRLDLF
jgi:hypothetical protein